MSETDILRQKRTIFCEVHVSRQPLVSDFPTEGIALPNEPTSAKWDSQHFTDIVSRRCSSPDDYEGLARVSQATWLLDQVFKASDERDVGVRLTRLNRLDQALRSCLALTMDQSEGQWGLFCTANAILFRYGWPITYPAKSSRRPPTLTLQQSPFHSAPEGHS